MADAQVDSVERDPFSQPVGVPDQWSAPQTWSDIVRVFAEFTTVCMDFGTLDPEIGSATQEVRVRVPPQTAKILHLYLSLAVADWEERYGEIPLARAEHMVGDLLHRAIEKGEE